MSDNPFYRAIEVLRERGWHQGDLADEHGAVCALGAYHVAQTGSLSRWVTLLSLLRPGVWRGYVLLDDLAYAEHGEELITFNDDPSTSYEDVELLLKKAAVAWSESHG